MTDEDIRRYDVAILGGGLAGLSLSMQLKRQRPETTVAVLEQREGPAPRAAFKVGESTVPSGAHYFASVIGMEDHLRAEQLKKCGLRFFLPANGNADITKRIEFGPDRFPPHDNFQLDRGLFENELAARARALGVDVLQGARVGDVTFGGDLHQVAFSHDGGDRSATARWVVDAAGRAGLLKRQLGLGKEVPHKINAAWFRLAGGLDLEDWGRDNEAWMAKMSEPGLRKFSTNHLMGEGYWVWMIPLSNGSISIGACADPRYHAYEEINELERLVDWLKRHEPPLGAAVEPRLGDVEDFLRAKDFAYGVERVFSPERWCLVGDAGAFADAFYSPGSDMIGYGNSFVTDLVSRDLDGEEIGDRLEYFNDLYLRTFDFVLSKYVDQYPVFGNVWVAEPKIAWDSFYHHAGVVLLFVKDKLADHEFMQTVDDDLDRLYRLDRNIQKLFREWHELEQRAESNTFLGGAAIGTQRDSFLGLVKPFDEAGLRAEMSKRVRVAEGWAVAMFDQASTALAERVDPDRAINPYAVGLRPERWDEDGMFDEPGLTVAEAKELAMGSAELRSGPPSLPDLIQAGGRPGGPPGRPPA
jgi:flavin-dependent dehydrogenase